MLLTSIASAVDFEPTSVFQVRLGQFSARDAVRHVGDFLVLGLRRFGTAEQVVHFVAHDGAGFAQSAVVIPSKLMHVAFFLNSIRVEDGLEQRVCDVADLPRLAAVRDVLAVEDVALPAVWNFALAAAAAICSGRALVELEHEGLVDAVLGVFARVDAVFDQAVAPGAGAETVADPLGCFFEDRVAVLGDVVHGDSAGDQRAFV
jgi:hypothetical protein